MYVPEPISKLIEGFMRLPGIGPKTAQRLAFYVLTMEEEDVLDLAKALVRVQRDLCHCSVLRVYHGSGPLLYLFR